MSEAKTQKAEQVRVYDVTRSTAQSYMLSNFYSELFGIPTAYGNTVNYNTLDASQLHARALGYGIRGVLAVGKGALSAISTAVVDVATKLNLEYNSGLHYANDVQRYTKLASGSNRDITITSADYTLANSRGVFDPNNPYDMESLEHIARGIAIERNDKQMSLWTAKLPTIDFKVIGKVDYQGHNPYLYFDIDANTDKPTILPIPYQPKSILLDNRDRYYDVTRSTAQSSMFFGSLPRVSFIPRVNADTLVFTTATATEIELGFEGALTAIYGLGKGALALGRTVLPIARGIPQATVVVGGAIGLYQGAKFEHEHPWIGDDFNEIMLNPLVPQETKDAMWKQMQNDPLLVGQRQSSQTTELPAMDFKVMGRVDGQGHSGNIVSPYFDIDPNAGKPTILSTPVPYQPKSILFTPDNQDRLLEWSKLPGFTPSMVKIWQESFPDHSDLGNSMLILQKSNPQFDEYITNLQPGNKIDYTKIDYQDASYHHQNSTGIIKSKAPTNPLSALKNTFKIKDTTDRLIGVDVENKEIQTSTSNPLQRLEVEQVEDVEPRHLPRAKTRPAWADAALAIHQAEPHTAPSTVAIRLETEHGFPGVQGRQVKELWQQQNVA